MRIDGRNLTLVIGGLDVHCDATSVVLDNEPADADLVTFADVIAGNDRRWFLAITALPGAATLPGYGAGTFWDLLWTTPAYTPISYVLNPHGVEDPTADQPIFYGDATVDQKPPVGGAAYATWTFDARLTCTAPPTRQTA